jgi:DNA-binding NtrC family response regulator
MGNQGNNKAKILIVDDETEISKLLADLLSDRHSCYTAESIFDGIALMSKEKFDLIFCDLNLRDGNGLEFLYRAKRKQPNVAVIVMSGLPTKESMMASLRLGAVDYIAKPFGLDRIENAVEAVLDMGESFFQNAENNVHLDAFIHNFINKQTLFLT